MSLLKALFNNFNRQQEGKDMRTLQLGVPEMVSAAEKAAIARITNGHAGFEAKFPGDYDTTKGLKQLEAMYIEYVYEQAKYNQSRAAKMLDISRGSLRMKLKEYFGNKYI